MKTTHIFYTNGSLLIVITVYIIYDQDVDNYKQKFLSKNKAGSLVKVELIANNYIYKSL